MRKIDLHAYPGTQEWIDCQGPYVGRSAPIGSASGRRSPSRRSSPSSRRLDYPSIPYARLFKEWDELGFSDEFLEKFYHGNAERILKL
jgi:hypothetical protein